MARLAVVDAGPLYATANAGDYDHEASRATLARADLQLVVPALALAEATYFVATRMGANAEAAFLRGLATLEIEAPTATDVERMAELVGEYADWPLGGTDASVVALAERLHAPIVITLDRRHFQAIRPRHRDTFELLP